MREALFFFFLQKRKLRFREVELFRRLPTSSFIEHLLGAQVSSSRSLVCIISSSPHSSRASGITVVIRRGDSN